MHVDKNDAIKNDFLRECDKRHHMFQHNLNSVCPQYSGLMSRAHEAMQAKCETLLNLKKHCTNANDKFLVDLFQKQITLVSHMRRQIEATTKNKHLQATTTFQEPSLIGFMQTLWENWSVEAAKEFEVLRNDCGVSPLKVFTIKVRALIKTGKLQDLESLVEATGAKNKAGIPYDYIFDL
jgi:hypothetical protein